jgi:transposase
MSHRKTDLGIPYLSKSAKVVLGGRARVPDEQRRQVQLQDSRDGAALVLDKIRIRFPWFELVWADSGYHARQVDAAVAIVPALRLEIVKRSDDMKGFVVLPRRWVVERTFSWFGRNRRLTKDYENLVETLAAFVALACIQIAVRRLAR